MSSFWETILPSPIRNKFLLRFGAAFYCVISKKLSDFANLFMQFAQKFLPRLFFLHKINHIMAVIG